VVHTLYMVLYARLSRIIFDTVLPNEFFLESLYHLKKIRILLYYYLWKLKFFI